MTVKGSVTVEPGAMLFSSSSDIRGAVSGLDVTWVFIFGGVVRSDITVHGSRHAAEIDGVEVRGGVTLTGGVNWSAIYRPTVRTSVTRSRSVERRDAIGILGARSQPAAQPVSASELSPWAIIVFEPGREGLSQPAPLIQREKSFMLKMSGTVWIDALAGKVWPALSKLGSIRLWTWSMRRPYSVREHAHRADAVGVCELGGNFAIRETVVAREEGTSFTYTGVGIPFVQSASNRWSVEDLGDKTIVTSSSEVVFTGGIAGRLLEPVMRVMSKRMARRSLASF